MSMHTKPLTAVEEEGLRLHGLAIGTPSQLSDAFRQGIAWAHRSALATPRQPEGEGLEVVAYQSIDATRGGGWMAHKHALPQAHIDQGALQEPLCRLSDAQRAIAELLDECQHLDNLLGDLPRANAELREECERLGRTLYDRNNELFACEAERDALRQQRNKIVGLLMEADASFVDGSEAGLELSDRIHAALAEVSK